ncbi:hypothetical protein T492DRAFT_941137 [Pavlovales sp. CCMP2436]|nr:hypothetical protein T492DRAFT_941137 [Pavlovales sp. CCMP2436]|mmetsp:Transcript_32977/g.77360  ORF Transcript_32977/g.77360 Transcript_32977/m.77360 type:complete len:212 (-) Transcript_32977:71-706(-)
MAERVTFTELRLNELSQRLSGMSGGTDMDRLEREAAQDRQRLQAAQLQINTLQTDVKRALALAGTGASASLAAAGSPVRRRPPRGTKHAEKLAAALRLNLRLERQLRDKSDEWLGRGVAGDLARFGAEVEAERLAQERVSGRVRANTAEQLRAAFLALDAERETREAVHTAYFSMLEELARRTREDLAEQRRQRQLADALLQEMAAKLGIS